MVVTPWPSSCEHAAARLMRPFVCDTLTPLYYGYMYGYGYKLGLHRSPTSLTSPGHAGSSSSGASRAHRLLLRRWHEKKNINMKKGAIQTGSGAGGNTS